MKALTSVELTEKIIEKAKSLGATITGVASVESLKASPSHRIYPKIGMEELADEAFRKSVIAGNKGAHIGLALVVKEEHVYKEAIKCLRWSAEAGRIDAIEDLQGRLGNKPVEMIEK